MGTYNNKYFKNVFNASEQELSSAGFGLLYKGKPVEGLWTSFQTNGQPIKSDTLKQITLYKLHFD